MTFERDLSFGRLHFPMIGVNPSNYVRELVVDLHFDIFQQLLEVWTDVH